MAASPRIVCDVGPGHRVWPFAASDGEVLATVSTTRTAYRPSCVLLRSSDRGETWTQLYDFAERNGTFTTGQPFSASDGSLLVGIWNAEYYEFGNAGLRIYRSVDRGATWEVVFEDVDMTYGKHFFEGTREGEFYLCAGIGGGGKDGRLGFTPNAGVLLKSSDHGASWARCLTVQSATSVYDGLISSGIVIVTARERRSVFRSLDGGTTWEEVRLSGPARSIARVGQRVMVSSDSALFVSFDDGASWVRHSCPIPSLFLRYPTSVGGPGWPDDSYVLVTAVGWRSLLLGYGLTQRRWWVARDFTSALGAGSLTRLARSDGFLLVGDETARGIMVRLPLESLRGGKAWPYVVRGSTAVRRAHSVIARVGSRGRG